MVEINTADDLAAFLTEIAKANDSNRHGDVRITLIIDPAIGGVRCMGYKGGRTYNLIVSWIEIIMSNGLDLHAAVTLINKELATNG